MFKSKASLILIGLLMLTSKLSGIAAQPTITVICDTDFNLQQASTPTEGLPGSLYLSNWFQPAPDTVASFSRMTQSNRLDIEVPITDEVATNLYRPTISPDGRLVVFSPGLRDLPLTLWDLKTCEIATLALTESEFVELSTGFLPLQREQMKLVWQDPFMLLINFLDPDERTLPRILATQEIMIQRDPLQMVRGQYHKTPYPAFPVGLDNSSPRLFLSPKTTYAALITNELISPAAGPRFHLQLYRSADQTLMLDLPASSTVQTSYAPVWTADETTLFFYWSDITERDDLLYVRTKLVEIEITNNFALDFSLWDRLTADLGQDLNILSSGFIPTFSPDEQKLAFKVYSPILKSHYTIIYTLATGEILATCDPTEMGRTDTILNFWSPDSDYVGQWDASNNQLVIFNTETGQPYRLPTDKAGFVGWVNNEK